MALGLRMLSLSCIALVLSALDLSFCRLLQAGAPTHSLTRFRKLQGVLKRCCRAQIQHKMQECVLHLLDSLLLERCSMRAGQGTTFFLHFYKAALTDYGCKV